MGGMTVLEWPLCTPPGFIRRIIPLATAARHSAWCISWGEAQRQSIYSDPAYQDGYYDNQHQPRVGLAAARMAALLTYRSRDSFESRFGRKVQTWSQTAPTATSPRTHSEVSLAIHNDGHRPSRPGTPRDSPNDLTVSGYNGACSGPSKIFSAQSYLRYQGDKFTARFDANCYIHITRKLDTHDVARGRTDKGGESNGLAQVLAMLPRHALVIGIQTDGLFLLSEQRELATHIPDSELVIIDSPDGHDGFLLEFEQINLHIVRYLQEERPDLYRGATEVGPIDFTVQKTSVFGEAESGPDVTRW
jgi:homoserine O-acetyltransferase/O-succinyltransferase